MFVLQNKNDPSFIPIFAFENFSLYVDIVTIAELIDRDTFRGSFSVAFKVLELYNKLVKIKLGLKEAKTIKDFLDM